MVLVLPFNVLLLLGPLSSLILMASYGKLLVLAQIALITLINAFVLKLLHFYPRDKIVSIFYKLRELGNKEAKQMFFNCVFTSWISPCAVWANNSLKRTKFLLHSVLITISVHILCTAALYFYLKTYGLAYSNHPPIFHCFPDPFNVTTYDQGVNLSNTLIQICEITDACLPRIRLCSDNELPLDKLELIILPSIFILQLLSIVAGGTLQWLGRYHRMLSISKKLRMVSPRLIQFLLIDLLLNPNHDASAREYILKMFRKSDEYYDTAKKSLEAFKRLPETDQNYPLFKFLVTMFTEDYEGKYSSVWNGKPPMHVAVLKEHYSRWYLLGMIGGKLDALNGQKQSSKNLIAEKITSKTLQLDQLHFLTRWWIKRSLQKFGQNALHNATKSKNVRLMQMLLENGHDSCKVHYGTAPIDMAIQYRHQESIKLLLDYEAKVDFWKLVETDEEGFQIVIEHTGAEYSDQNGRTPTHFAARSEKTTCLKMLIEKNANINLEDTTGMTPLHMAAKFCRYDCIKLLLEHQAKINARDIRSMTPLHFAAKAGSFDCTKMLIENGADTLLEDHKGWKPLHFAVQAGSLDCLKMLVQNCADVLTKDHDGLTPLNFAVDGGPKECIKVLAETEDVNGRTLLNRLAETDQTDLISSLIIKADVDLNVKNRNGMTPLHCAARAGHYECMKLLLNHDADVELQDEEGRTPLHYVVQANDSECLILLLHHIGPDPNSVDRQGMTPLHYAAKNGFTDCLELLVENGGDTLRRDDAGCTPLDYAAQQGNSRCSKILRKSIQMSSRSLPPSVIKAGTAASIDGTI